MKTRSALCLLVLALSACADEPTTEPETFSIPVYAAQAEQINFYSNMSGAEEFPDPRITNAAGRAFFHYDRALGVVEFRIRAHGVNMTMAHIHMAAAGANGQIVAWLWPDAPPASLKPGFWNAPLNAGTIEASELTGPLAGLGIDSLVAIMRNGNAYVNIHNTRYPSGLMRGQVDSTAWPERAGALLDGARHAA